MTNRMNKQTLIFIQKVKGLCDDKSLIQKQKEKQKYRVFQVILHHILDVDFGL